MLRSHKLVQMALLIGFLAGGFWLSPSIAAREQPAVSAQKSAAGAAASDPGALFTAFVPVLRHLEQGSQAEQKPKHRATRRASYER
jgi:hypothetical protein